jgi:hypothetical protein
MPLVYDATFMETTHAGIYLYPHFAHTKENVNITRVRILLSLAHLLRIPM